MAQWPRARSASRAGLARWVGRLVTAWTALAVVEQQPDLLEGVLAERPSEAGKSALRLVTPSPGNPWQQVADRKIDEGTYRSGDELGAGWLSADYYVLMSGIGLVVGRHALSPD